MYIKLHVELLPLHYSYHCHYYTNITRHTTWHQLCYVYKNNQLNTLNISFVMSFTR